MAPALRTSARNVAWKASSASAARRSTRRQTLSTIGPCRHTIASKDSSSRVAVHEAFAEPTVGRADPGPVVPKQPPDPVEEMPPEEKPEGENVVWIPGYWAWDDQTSDFLWVSGFWRAVPPGRQWVPGHWQAVTGGFQWVPGYWADPGREEVQYLPPPPALLEEGPSTPA